ncbi:hypothetical protein AC630_28880 [Bradyrhizobium sp. AS23.2]|nr:hypothetical protein AC630_28880 [Bradyrhizobium sp. AS23.2]
MASSDFDPGGGTGGLRLRSRAHEDRAVRSITLNHSDKRVRIEIGWATTCSTSDSISFSKNESESRKSGRSDS